MTVLRIASRASKLALVQTRAVADAIVMVRPDVEVQVVEVTTTGDIDRHSSVTSLTEMGAFVRAVQTAVLDGRADIAVHSCKDLPVAGPDGLTAVYPRRAAVNDVVVGGRLEDLAPGSRVGTGSPRRSAQLRRLRPDLEVVPIRGNVDTRIAKIGNGYEAVLVAEAGLRRLGRSQDIGEILDLDSMVPAPAQGALAVESRVDGPWWEVLSAVEHLPTRVAVEHERLLLALTGAGCRSALGAHLDHDADRHTMRAFIEDDDGPRGGTVSGSDPRELVERLIDALSMPRVPGP